MTETRFLRLGGDLNTPKGLRNRTFLDAFADVFTPPEALILRRPEYGFVARVRDMHRIGADCRKAAVRLGLEEDDASR